MKQLDRARSRGGVMVLGVLAWAAQACGGTPSATYRPGIEIDAGADTGPGGGTAGSDAGMPPPPMTAPGSTRIVPGSVTLLGKGPPCTNEIGSTADMWCAFLRPSALQSGGSSLFVVDVTQAVAGAKIECGAPAGDPNCLLLTGGFVEDDTHSSFFQGNTLVYYDQTATPYGWRPGMLNGRRLVAVTSATGDAHDCTAARVGDAVACLQDVPAPASVFQGSDPTSGVSTTARYSDLLVGRVNATSPVLDKVETVISSDTADDLQRFQFRLVSAATGDRIAWSTRSRPGAAEVLKVQKIGDDASRQVVAVGVSRWVTSGDGTRWAWLSAFNYDSQGPSGALQVAGFPDGAAPISVLDRVASFSFVGNQGIEALDDGGRLYGIPDLTASATNRTPLDTGVIGVIAASPDGHLAYVKSFDFVFDLVDLFVTNFDGSGPTCGLDRREEVPFRSSLGPHFLANGTTLLWGRVTNLDTTDDRLIAAGKFTHLADCTTETVAADLVTMGALGTDGITVSDSYDGTSGTLRIRGLTNGGAMLASGDATVVQTRMDTSLSLYPFLHALLFTVNVGDPSDGLYLRPVAAAAN